MTPKQAKKITKKACANAYASIYDSEYKKIARQAFGDGMVFWGLVQAGAVTEDMAIDEVFFKTLREVNSL